MIKGKVTYDITVDQKWQYVIWIGRDCITNYKWYESKHNALRAAKRVADKLGITLEVGGDMA